MKFKSPLLIFLFCVAGLAASANDKLPGPGNGDEGTKKSDIAGGVVNADTKKPLNSVSVTAYANSKKEKAVTTDGNGNYNFSDLKPGTYKFVFEKSGYRKVTKEKVISRSDEGCQLNIEMDAEEDFQIMPSQFF